MTTQDLASIRNLIGPFTTTGAASRQWLQDQGLDPDNFELRIQHPDGGETVITDARDLSSAARRAIHREASQQQGKLLTSFGQAVVNSIRNSFRPVRKGDLDVRQPSQAAIEERTQSISEQISSKRAEIRANQRALQRGGAQDPQAVRERNRLLETEIDQLQDRLQGFQRRLTQR